MDQTIVYSARERLLFASNQGGLSVFSVEDSGSLSGLPGSPFGGGGFAGLAVIESRDSTFVYAAERARNRIRGFHAQGMTLTELPSSPYPAGKGAHAMAQTEDAIYCLAGDQRITGYRVRGDGALSRVPGSPYRVSGFRTSVLTIAIEPRGRFLYGIDSYDERVHGARLLRETGALVRLAGAPFKVIRSPGSVGPTTGMVFDTSGSGFAVGDSAGAANHIQAIRRLRQGRLVSVGKARRLAHGRVGAAALDPSGRFLLTGDIEAGSLSSYRILRRGQQLAVVDQQDIEGRRGSPRPTGITFAQF